MISRSCENPLPSDKEQWNKKLQGKCVYVVKIFLCLKVIAYDTVPNQTFIH